MFHHDARKSTNLRPLLLLGAALAVAACAGDDDQTPQGPGGQPNKPDAPQPGIGLVQSAVSECGGFATHPEATTLANDADTGYCDAEVLHWSHDPAKGTISFSDKRVLLNCCGDHSVEVTQDNDVFVITERDAPEGGAGRCRCMCVFDFSFEIKVPAGPFAFKLQREVTDSGDGPQLIHEGQIADPTVGSGQLLLDNSDVGPWCEEPETPPATHTFAVSECGGFGDAGSASWGDADLGSGDYCDAELLRWRLDDQGNLQLSNERVPLNCCGDHSVEVTEQNGVYLITEIDAPESATNSRCFCTCVFDFAVELKGVGAGPVQIKVMRDVTDDNQPAQLVFEGQLDTTAGSGVEIIDDTEVAYGCEDPVDPPVTFSFEVSECGGMPQRSTLDYCDAEVLDWSYDAGSHKLSLANNRVSLNCCGDHSVEITREGNKYIMREIDAPQDGNLRCRCMCVYDFTAELEAVPLGTIDLEVIRTITDTNCAPNQNCAPATVFAGQLDLALGEGTEIINTDQVMGCTN